ncbi:MAG: hypothetical protein JNK64_27850 [Myxococcales bacterium]|nr:hypothetical protein [Myxococcales bacterium]
MNAHASTLIRPRLLRALALALILLAACGKSAPHVKHYDEGEAGFQAFADDLVAAAKRGDDAMVTALARSATLPDPAGWFTATFGADAGARLADEYTHTGLPQFATDAAKVMRRLVQDEGRSKVETRRIADAKDERGTGFQSRALRTMVAPVPLYAMRFQRPDGSKVYSLWSFVYVDGGYRIVGKLKKADPAPMSDDLQMLSELPIADARALLAEH